MYYLSVSYPLLSFSSLFFLLFLDVLLSLVIHTEVQENLHAPEVIVEITEAHLIKTCTHKDFFFNSLFSKLEYNYGTLTIINFV